MNDLPKAYRQILRHVRELPSASKTSTHQFVLESFKQGRLEPDESKADLLKWRAINYATMISSVKQLAYLRSLDTGERLDPREKIKRTAARVGFSVPQFTDELELGNVTSTSTSTSTVTSATTVTNKGAKDMYTYDDMGTSKSKGKGTDKDKEDKSSKK